MIASPTTATPAPMPACAPVDNPPDELDFLEASEVAVYVAVEGSVDLVFPAFEEKVVDNGKSFSRQFSWNIGAYIVTPSRVAVFVSSVNVAGRVSQLRTVSPVEHEATCSDPIDATLVHV